MTTSRADDVPLQPRAARPPRRRRGSRIGRLGVLAAAALVVLGAASCSTVGYYWQGVRGQAELLARAEPIDQVIAEASDRELREKLALVKAVRRFATDELGLPDNGSYRRYANLGRPFVVWNVVAVPELSLEPQQWCFPIAGCVSYRGFFAEADARAEASRLRSEGYDVHVGGVPAYSTLGYFDDPVLSTFIDFPDHEVARLIFHELAHQVVYVRDDSTFNESFAVTVEEAGIERWLAVHAHPGARAEFERVQMIHADFRDLVGRYRRQLAEVYASAASESDKRRRKAEILSAMRAEHELLAQTRWGGYRGYEAWFARANNASLAAIGLYTDGVPAFKALLARVHGDLRRFYVEAGKLASASQRERSLALSIQ